LGDETGISEDLKTAFNDTGARHIIAISGFNITIIAGVFLSLSRRWLGVRRGLWLAGAGIGLYAVLVGADASVVRSLCKPAVSLTR
jgi:competence protein ComEC